MMLFLLADETASATATANTSLVFSICSFVVVPLITLWLNKYFESRRQSSEASTLRASAHAALAETRAKIDADAMLAKAKLEVDAGLARARLEFDSKFVTVAAQHKDCENKYAALEAKFTEREKQAAISAEERAEMREKIERFQAFLDKRAEREKEFGKTP